MNADVIEKSFIEKHLVNLAAFDLNLSNSDFTDFLKKEGSSWIKKAESANALVNINFSENNLIADGKPNAYDAALAADFIRHELLKADISFTFESVFSHHSKVKFIEQAISQGYKCYIYFICTNSPDINVERVAQRVVLGGHDVPTEKIKSRYYQSLSLLKDTIPLAHRCYLFDNSAQNQEINLVAEIEAGKKLTVHKEDMPWWAEEYVIDSLFK